MSKQSLRPSHQAIYAPEVTVLGEIDSDLDEQGKNGPGVQDVPAITNINIPTDHIKNSHYNKSDESILKNESITKNESEIKNEEVKIANVSENEEVSLPFVHPFTIKFKNLSKSIVKACKLTPT